MQICYYLIKDTVMSQGKTPNEEFLEEIERVKNANKRKKSVNSKQKGNRGELDLCKIMEKHFKKTFKRVPQSGAHVGGTNYNSSLREDAIEILAGDIITPKEFVFLIEHKNYKQEAVNITNLLSEKEYDVNRWWFQCKQDAERSKKKPLLIIKLGRSERFVFVQNNSYLEKKLEALKAINYFTYVNEERESILVINLKYLLENFGQDFWGI